MKQRKTIAKRLEALLLSAATVLSLLTVMSGGSGDAQAALSLPHVQSLKYGGAVNILEIVPSADEGSLGYYITGQEPCASWLEETAKRTSPTARGNYANGIFASLTNNNIMGAFGTAAETYPLTSLGNYSEIYPWSYKALSGEEQAQYTPLTLGSAEIVTLTGTFSCEDGGAFRLLDKNIELSSKSNNGHVPVVQMVDCFVYYDADDVPAGLYWYEPSFTKIDNSASVTGGTPVYVLASAPGVKPIYAYAGDAYENGFTFSAGTDYYTASVVGAPTSTRDDTHRYAAVSAGFRFAKNGEEAYFRIQKNAINVEYVGEGGNTGFITSGNQQTKVEVGEIYYKGGYENNNWFWRYVMDWEEGEPEPTVSIKVNTVVGNEVTVQQLREATLIYLSAGYPDNSRSSYYSGNDISQTVYAEMKNLCISTSTIDMKRAIIVDKRLVSEWAQSERAYKLAGELCYYTGPISSPYNNSERVVTQNGSGKAIDANVYCAPALLPSTPTDFYAAKDWNSSAYSPVRQGIITENSGRVSAQKLPEQVSIANTIRYLLNRYRLVEPQNTVRVLSIEPGKAKHLTENMVKTWMGRSADSQLSVEISYASAARLVGMTEDICENYDLIYIGSDISDYATRTDVDGSIIRDYNDDTMDGMVYTNIGDLVVAGGESGWSLSGLLDRDYDTSRSFGLSGYYPIDTGTWQAAWPPFLTHDNARTFRYSGNDITKNKMLEVESFAAAGFPVVIEDELLKTRHNVLADGKAGNAQFEISFIFTLGRPTGTFTVSISDTDAEENTLTATLADTSSLTELRSAQYIWYRLRNGETTELRRSEETGSNTDTLTLSAADPMQQGDEYYCEVEPKHLYYAGLFHSGDFISQENAVSETVTVGSSVDNSSYMYELISAIKDKDNVMSAAEAEASALGTSGSLNSIIDGTEHVEIAFAQNGMPTEYSMDESGAMTSLVPDANGKYFLNFTFAIKTLDNADTVYNNYTARLFLDLNGDGRFRTEDNEEVSDIEIKDGTGKAVTNGALQRSANGFTINYTLSKQLQEDMVGIIPWRLEVVSAENDAVRCSKQGFTRVTPKEDQKPTVNVLQINTSRTTTSWFGSKASSGLNLQSNIENGGTFKGLLDKVKDFGVNIVTVKAGELDTLAASYKKYCDDPMLEVAGGDNAALVAVLRAAAAKDVSFSCQSTEELLDAFDMLMMGFDDCYQELSKSSSEAIVKFIDTGKATLFSHDNTSFFFLPTRDYRTDRVLGNLADSDIFGTKYYVYAPEGTLEQLNAWLNGDYSAFGYNFNMTIRDRVGLDRYGVTSKNYGLTTFSGAKTGESGIVASEKYLSMTEDEKNALLGAGYSIAYMPGSGRKSTVGETQGLTNGILTRYHVSGAYPTKDSYNSSSYSTTTEITQLNKGQITTYPFDVNTAEFGGTADEGGSGRISISPTHVQYDQLNMNSDDITVWYCLAGGEFDYMPNDAVNSYYIYNRGNVTYTGFGHTTPGAGEAVNENEAKLLVNTIVAAYRCSAPSIKFTDVTGTKELSTLFLPSDDGVLLSAQSPMDPDRQAHFIIDGNVSPTTLLSVKFFLPDSEDELNVKVYYLDENGEEQRADKNALFSGRIYYIKLDELYSRLENMDESAWRAGVALSAALSVKGSSQPVGDVLTLRSLSLFNLA